jgi:putative nucleotidyltransferase with HDIG domain
LTVPGVGVVTMQRYRLLHVEDDAMDTRLFGMMLDELRVPRAGVRHAERVESALEFLRHEAFDIVFLDLDLPDSGGLDTVERVLSAGFDVPVVVLTGIQDEDLGVRAVSLGAQDYLVKNAVHAGVLGRVLRYAVGRQQALTTAKRASARAAAVEARLEASQAVRSELEREATERREAQERLEASLAQLHSLRSVDSAIIADLPLEQVLDAILGAAVPLLPVDAAAFSVIRSHGLRVVASRGLVGRDELAEPLGRDDPAVRAAWSDGYAVCFAADEDPAQPSPHGARLESLHRLGLSEYHVLALTARGEPLGVLELYARTRGSAERPEWLEFAETHCAQAAAAIDAMQLRSRLVSANDEVLLAYDSTIRGWSRALDLRDRETMGHSSRVTDMAVQLARSRGFDPVALGHLRRGALLHDIGKMAVPDAILLKPGPLTAEERCIMQQHTVFGRDLLEPIRYLRDAVDVPYAHHERWDGAGYPRGLAGTQIPLAARIFAVVDVYDALTSDRPYRGAWSRRRALEHIAAAAGSHFDPEVVAAFLEL